MDARAPLGETRARQRQELGRGQCAAGCDWFLRTAVCSLRYTVCSLRTVSGGSARFVRSELCLFVARPARSQFARNSLRCARNSLQCALSNLQFRAPICHLPLATLCTRRARKLINQTTIAYNQPRPSSPAPHSPGRPKLVEDTRNRAPVNKIPPATPTLFWPNEEELRESRGVEGAGGAAVG